MRGLTFTASQPPNGSHAYESGYYFDFTVVGRGLTAPTPFTGTFTFTRTIGSTSTQLGSMPVSWTMQPREPQQFTTPWRDTVIPTPGQTIRYDVTYTETLSTAPLVVLPGSGSMSQQVSIVSRTTLMSSSTLDGSAVRPGATKGYRISGTITTGARGLNRTVNVQKYDTSKKKWVAYARAGYDRGSGQFSYTIPKTSGQTTKFRVSIPAYFGYSSAASSSVTVDRRLLPVKIFNQVMPTKYQITGTKNSLTVYVNSFSPEVGQKLTLQRYSSSKKTWANVSAGVTAKPGKRTFALPTGSSSSATATHKYRVRLDKNANFTSTSVSPTVSVRIENPKHYTGLAREFYNGYKAYCPAIVPRVDGSRAGAGAWAYADIANGVTYFSPKVTSQHRRTVALHECAHHQQWKAAHSAKGKGWASLKRSFTQVYGNWPQSGIEYNADCVADYWSRNSYWSYGGQDRCGGPEQKRWTRAIAKGTIP